MGNTGTVSILNETNGLSYTFNLTYKVSRLFLGDGTTTITIDQYLPLVDGLNKLKINRSGEIIYLNLTKIPAIEGQYVKWLNQYGQWNYWLFNCIYKRTRTSKDLGEIFNDFDDVGDTTSPYKNLGMTSSDTLTLIAENISENDQEVINGILDSPKIFYYTGIRLTQVNDVSWLAAKLKPGSTAITDYKKTRKNYKLQIELPPRYTMKL